MLPRDKQKICHRYKKILSGILLFLLFSTNPLWAQDAEKHNTNALTGIFDFYQEVISPVDGDRCPMYPSCSQYAKHSIQKHGLALGWIMSMDRLLRCGRDEKTISPALYTGEKKYIYDPVRNNDDWWTNE